MIDPICGMTVAPDSPRRFAFDGATYYFCSDHCLKKFSADPVRYVVPAKAGTQAGGDAHGLDSRLHGNDATYTCPMHPEVRQPGPGTCPKCGMALEPEMPSTDEGENPELVDFRRRFWWTLPLTVVVVRAGHGRARLLPAFVVGAQAGSSWSWRRPSSLWAAWPFFVRCWTVDPHVGIPTCGP